MNSLGGTLFPWEEITLWYKKYGKHNLPWRDYSPRSKNIGDLLYRVWLSEILLQQTQVERVIPYLERILERFPTVDSLADTDYDTFFPYYQGMGYYSRARNILKTAKIVSELYDGIFPSEDALLATLPGVGPYTRNAIKAFGYGIPVLAWDTNLEKAFSRYLKGRKDIRLSPEEKEMIEEDFQKYVRTKGNEEEEKQAVRDINNALMDFSRLIDNKNSRLIDWENYPLHSGKFYESQGSLEPLVEKRIQRFPTADAHIVAILHESHKVYYSVSHDSYSPYILVGVGETDTRGYVQRYFREKFSIEVSVRPVHKKWMGDDGIAYIAVYVQIQAGKLEAKTYKKEEILDNLTLYKKEVKLS